ncbi:hypothetical protein [Sporisorium scitamineum]|uniref:Uncharacterized protein n=1 Tax=Sporisorium scitamineum TaxID=49012 RepID=A0A0F7RVB9_9BASI|nr:hypothetical protein [Sporisorium scitamineum]
MTILGSIAIGYLRGHLTAAVGVAQYIQPKHRSFPPSRDQPMLARMRTQAVAEPEMVEIDKDRIWWSLCSAPLALRKVSTSLQHVY